MREKYKQMGILQIDDLSTLNLRTVMFLYNTNMLPHPIQRLFTSNTTVHSHSTRHCTDPHIRTHKTCKLSLSLLHKAPITWQRLPQDIKEK